MPTTNMSSSASGIQRTTSSEPEEDAEFIRESLDNLKKWTEENPNLHIRNEDKYLLIFLRCCKYDLKKTKERIKNFYLMKRDRKLLFRNRDPLSREVQGLIKMGTFFVLKNNHENRPVVIIRPTIRDPSVYTLDDVVKSGSMVLDILALEEEYAQIYGIITIVDLTNVSFMTVTELSIPRLKYMVSVWQNYYCRPQQIVFINVPAYINVFLKIVKSFMTAKMRDRIQVHHDSNFSLTNVVDKKLLPPEYGGEGETIEELANYWSDKMISYSQWFKEDEKFRAE